MRSLILLAGICCVAMQAATVLTFDVNGILNFQVIDQDYGDRVSGPSDSIGSYGTDDASYTPNVLVSYGSPGEDPSLWTTGYGNLTNIYFNDIDGDTTLTVTWDADPGFLVRLLDFDIASFLSGGQTVQGIAVLDGSNNVLWSQGSTFASGTTSTFVSVGVAAQHLSLVVDLTGLGTVSDDIGLDNIRFSQEASAVPEPGTVGLAAAGLALVCCTVVRRRNGTGGRHHPNSAEVAVRR